MAIPIDEFFTESGNFIQDEESNLYSFYYNLLERANLLKDDTSSGSEIDINVLIQQIEQLIEPGVSKSQISNSTTPITNETSHDATLSYLKGKIGDRFERYINDELTLSEFIYGKNGSEEGPSGQGKDYDRIYALYSIGVFNLFKHSTSKGMAFRVNNGKMQNVYIKSVTDNTFTVSYHLNGDQAQDFIEGKVYTLYIANWQVLAQEIQEYIDFLVNLANNLGKLFDDLLNFTYPSEFMGLDISTLPIGTLIDLGTNYKPRSFTDREMLDVIKYFALIIKKMVKSFKTFLETQPKNDVLNAAVQSLEILNNLLTGVLILVNISATILDVVTICREILPKFEILASIIGAWLNPALLSKLGGIFMQEGQKIVDKAIVDVEKQITSYLFKIPVPLPTFILDFFLDPQPIPKAGDSNITAAVKLQARAFGDAVDDAQTASDAALESIKNYKLKESPPKEASNSKPTSSAKKAKDL
jgi:hypothetical protein